MFDVKLTEDEAWLVLYALDAQITDLKVKYCQASPESSRKVIASELKKARDVYARVEAVCKLSPITDEAR